MNGADDVAATAMSATLSCVDISGGEEVGSRQSVDWSDIYAQACTINFVADERAGLTPEKSPMQTGMDAFLVNESTGSSARTNTYYLLVK